MYIWYDGRFVTTAPAYLIMLGSWHCVTECEWLIPGTWQED